jgi:hypothetical protein
MQIHILRNGTPSGPYSLDAVRSLLSNGSLQPYDLARVDGAEEWVPLASIPGIVIAPLSSTLAIWSLVLGILGIAICGIPSLPAIICGHLAHHKIRKSQGLLTGSGLAIAGFVLGYIGLILLPVLAAAGFAAGNAAILQAKRVTAVATIVGIEASINSFYTEYNALPSGSATIDTVTDASLAKTLLGNDPARNVRAIKFLTVGAAKSHKNGLDATTAQIFDPWGRGYQVILDTSYKEEVTVTRGSITETIKGRRAVVYSLGKDGIPGTADDVKNW